MMYSMSEKIYRSRSGSSDTALKKAMASLVPKGCLSGFEAFITERLLLHVVQFTVITVDGHQFVVTALLHYASFVQHVYLVGVLYCRQAVGYGYGRARLHKPLQCVLHKSLALCIES